MALETVQPEVILHHNGYNRHGMEKWSAVTIEHLKKSFRWTNELYFKKYVTKWCNC